MAKSSCMCVCTVCASWVKTEEPWGDTLNRSERVWQHRQLRPQSSCFILCAGHVFLLATYRLRCSMHPLVGESRLESLFPRNYLVNRFLFLCLCRTNVGPVDRWGTRVARNLMMGLWARRWAFDSNWTPTKEICILQLMGKVGAFAFSGANVFHSHVTRSHNTVSDREREKTGADKWDSCARVRQVVCALASTLTDSISNQIVFTRNSYRRAIFYWTVSTNGHVESTAK